MPASLVFVRAGCSFKIILQASWFAVKKFPTRAFGASRIPKQMREKEAHMPPYYRFLMT
jgi:hypothetical protein